MLKIPTLKTQFEKEIPGEPEKTPKSPQSEKPTVTEEQQQTGTNAPISDLGEPAPPPEDQRKPGGQAGWVMIPINQITVLERLRDADQESVNMLAQSIDKDGLITPISVRKKGEELILTIGLHRLLACKTLGWKDIPAIVEDISDTQAKIKEIVENLYRVDLTVLQKAVHVVALRAEYQKAHPGKMYGGDRRSEAARSKSQNENLKSATQEAGKIIRVSESSIQRLASIGMKIDPEVKALIGNTEFANSLTTLLRLATYSPVQQKKIAQELVSGEAESVREVLEHMAKS